MSLCAVVRPAAAPSTGPRDRRGAGAARPSCAKHPVLAPFAVDDDHRVLARDPGQRPVRQPGVGVTHDEQRGAGCAVARGDGHADGRVAARLEEHGLVAERAEDRGIRAGRRRDDRREPGRVEGERRARARERADATAPHPRTARGGRATARCPVGRRPATGGPLPRPARGPTGSDAAAGPSGRSPRGCRRPAGAPIPPSRRRPRRDVAPRAGWSRPCRRRRAGGRRASRGRRTSRSSMSTSRLAGPGSDPGDHGREVVPAPGGRAGDADHPADPGRRAGALHRGDQRGASAPGTADDEQVPVGGGRPDGTLVTLALGLVGQPDDERARRDRTSCPTRRRGRRA